MFSNEGVDSLDHQVCFDLCQDWASENQGIVTSFLTVEVQTRGNSPICLPLKASTSSILVLK